MEFIWSTAVALLDCGHVLGRKHPEKIVAMASILILGGVLPLAVAYVSEIAFGLHPCHFCLLQRYPYLVVIAAGTATLLLPRMGLRWRFAVALGILGTFASGLLGLIHTGIERGWLNYRGGCVAQAATDGSLDALRNSILNAPIVACNEVSASLFGLSMASWNALWRLAFSFSSRCNTASSCVAMASETRRRLPGDFAPRHAAAAALRVDHAGEYGAQRIYAGQLAVLKNHVCAGQLKHMAAQEEEHLAAFNKLLPEYGVRPTLLMPFWHVAGWALGAATAAMGARAAMACTVAVESVITEHYNSQLAQGELDPALHGTLAKFRDEEMEHHDIGLANEAEQAPFYGALTRVIRGACRSAIWLSARI